MLIDGLVSGKVLIDDEAEGHLMPDELGADHLIFEDGIVGHLIVDTMFGVIHLYLYASKGKPALFDEVFLDSVLAGDLTLRFLMLDDFVFDAFSGFSGRVSANDVALSLWMSVVLVEVGRLMADELVTE